MQPVNEVGHQTTVAASTPAPIEFDLLDVLLVLAARKRLILGWTLVGLFVAGVFAFCIARPTYTAEAVIMPPQREQSSSSALMGQLGSLAALSGGSVGSALGLKNPNDLYLGILQSRTIADALIRKFDLMHLYHQKLMSRTRSKLKSRSKFVSGKDSLITISVEDQDPRRAADMANAYVAELYDLNNHLALTEASQRRIFFAEQLEQEKDRLADAEVALKKTEEATGIIAPNGQMETIIRQIAQLQAEITSRQVQLDALRMSSTAENPDVVRLGAEIGSLQAQLKNLENGPGKHVPGDISMTAADVPGVGLEYIRKQRDVKYHQLLFDLLARQYEAARIDEEKAVPVIQVVDPAGVPDWKSGPKRLVLTFVGGLLGFSLSLAWVLVLRTYRKLETDPERSGKLMALRQALAWPSRP